MVPRYEEELNSFGLLRAVPILINRKDVVQPSAQVFSSRSHDLARNVVTSPNGIPRERLVNNARSKMAPSDWRRVITLQNFAVNA